jgi:hypothetical protein
MEQLGARLLSPTTRIAGEQREPRNLDDDVALGRSERT